MRRLSLLLLCWFLLTGMSNATPESIRFSCAADVAVYENGLQVATGPSVSIPATSRTERLLVLRQAGHCDKELSLTWLPVVDMWRTGDGQFLVDGQEFHLRPMANPKNPWSSLVAVLGLLVCGAWLVMRRSQSVSRAALEEEYAFVRTLGSGVSGTVFEACRRSDGSRWAVKVLRQHSWKGFEREAAIWARLYHPGIVRLHSWGHMGRCPYLVMELVEGETLRSVMSRERMSVEDCLHYLREMLTALRSAHRMGVVHRDLKPENMMVTGRNRIRIMDLGSARDVESIRSTIEGTPRYMAPEQFNGSTAPAVDVYALGTVAYEMLTGLRPFEQGSIWELRTAKLTMTPRSLQEVRPDLPPALASVVERMMAPNPACRPQDAGEALELLQEATACFATVAA